MHPKNRKVPADAIIRRDAKTASPRELALRYGVTVSVMRRKLRALGLLDGEKPRGYTEEEVARISTLIEEGMPTVWIAEGMGRTDRSISKRFSGHPAIPERNHEWSTVWGQIKNRSQLLELHRQFAPPIKVR